MLRIECAKKGQCYRAATDLRLLVHTFQIKVAIARIRNAMVPLKFLLVITSGDLLAVDPAQDRYTRMASTTAKTVQTK